MIYEEEKRPGREGGCGGARESGEPQGAARAGALLSGPEEVRPGLRGLRVAPQLDPRAARSTRSARQLLRERRWIGAETFKTYLRRSRRRRAFARLGHFRLGGSTRKTARSQRQGTRDVEARSRAQGPKDALAAALRPAADAPALHRAPGPILSGRPSRARTLKPRLEHPLRRRTAYHAPRADAARAEARHGAPRGYSRRQFSRITARASRSASSRCRSRSRHRVQPEQDSTPPSSPASSSRRSAARTQISGPTGAFIVVVYGIVQQYGYEGLAVARSSPVMLIAMAGEDGRSPQSFLSVTVSSDGIALIIFRPRSAISSAGMDAVPAGFVEKWIAIRSSGTATSRRRRRADLARDHRHGPRITLGAVGGDPRRHGGGGLRRSRGRRRTLR